MVSAGETPADSENRHFERGRRGNLQVITSGFLNREKLISK